MNNMVQYTKPLIQRVCVLPDWVSSSKILCEFRFIKLDANTIIDEYVQIHELNIIKMNSGKLTYCDSWFTCDAHPDIHKVEWVLSNNKINHFVDAHISSVDMDEDMTYCLYFDVAILAKLMATTYPK